MTAQVSTATWLYPFSDDNSVDKLSVEVRRNGDIWISGTEPMAIMIAGKDVREAHWLADALLQAAELSKKRPLDV